MRQVSDRESRSMMAWAPSRHNSPNLEPSSRRRPDSWACAAWPSTQRFAAISALTIVQSHLSAFREQTHADPDRAQGGDMTRLKPLIACRRGATAIEYALVASLISIAALLAFQTLGDRIDLMYGNVSNKL